MLWKKFILNPNCKEEAYEFFEFLSKFDNMSDWNSTYLFENYFLKEDFFPYKYIDIESYNCFVKYLLRYNSIKGNVTLYGDNPTFLKKDLIGMEILWYIVFNSNDSRVRNECTATIGKMYHKIFTDEKINFKGLVSRFISDELNQIENFVLDTENIERFILILKQFFSQ